VCLDCKTYVPIHAHNFVANKKLKRFERKHRYHSLQIIDKDELKPIRTFDPIYTEVD